MPLASQLNPRLATVLRLAGAVAIAGALLYFAFQVQRPRAASGTTSTWAHLDRGQSALANVHGGETPRDR